jgi:methylenetetrahydrofolate reductase (NADPH)
MSDPGQLQRALNNGHMAVIVECVPPKGADVEALRKTAAVLRGKVDAVGVADNRDEIRMSAIAAAALLKNEGLETIVHMVTRDRNRIALVSDVLGAQALGLTNVLCTSGDHQTLGAERAARNVFDLDSVQLLYALDEIRRVGRLFGNGRSIEPCSLTLGAVAHPQADPPELQSIRLAKKVRAGADFIITQPVFDTEAFGRWLESLGPFEIVDRKPILAGILIVPSAARAREINERAPGVRIPEALIEKLEQAGPQARATAIRFAAETIERLKSLRGVKGFYLMTEDDPAGAVELIETSGLSVSK